MRVLYVCHIGRLRSLTAAALTNLETTHKATFRGIDSAKSIDYSNVVQRYDIQNADKIVCFSSEYQDYLYKHFNVHPNDTTLWNIPDNYDAFDPELVAILRDKIKTL